MQRDEVCGAEIAASRRLAVHQGQFIVSRIDARNGAFGIVPKHLDGAVVSSDFPAFEVRSDRILPRYLEWLSKTSDFVALCRGASEGTTNRVRLKEDRFLSMKIPVPPLPDQRRIVAQVEQLAAKIEYAQGLRRQAAEEVTAMHGSTLRRLFAALDACEVSVESVCAAIIDNLHSNPIYSDGGVPCIRSPDVGWGILHLDRAFRTDEREFLRRSVRGQPRVNDIVFVREGGGTGKAAMVEEGQRFSLGQRVMILRPNTTKVVPKFLLHQLLSPLVYNDQIVPLCKGSASPHLNIGALRRFRLRLPSLPEQRRTVAYLDDLQAKVDALKCLQAETAAQLDAMLPSILDKAFKGEL
ncbi:MAG: restriction endonuclease subunit S [Dehalococcoidia bacterium]